MLLSLFMLAGIGGDRLSRRARIGADQAGPHEAGTGTAAARAVNLPPAVAPAVAPVAAPARRGRVRSLRRRRPSVRSASAVVAQVSQGAIARRRARRRPRGSAHARAVPRPRLPATRGAAAAAAGALRAALRLCRAAVAGQAGAVIQLGVYYDPRQADAAWRRRGAAPIPISASCRRRSSPARGMPTEPVYYRLQLGTPLAARCAHPVPQPAVDRTRLPRRLT